MNSHGRSASLLIESARRGDATALGELLRAYRNYLQLLARTGIDASLRGKADASDVAQEALLKAARRFQQFRGTTEAELTAWLRRILARCLADLVRSYRTANGRNTARERSLDQMLDRSSHVLANVLAVNDQSPSEAAEQRDLGVVLADALAQLSADQREVIQLHDLDGLPWDEVARRMGRTPGAARMLWARALKQLRPLIDTQL